MSARWRLEALGELLFYVAAAVLVVALPLHLLEHLPEEGVLSAFKQPTRIWALWLVLIFAGFHSMWGLRKFLFEYVRGPTGRKAVTVATMALALIIIVIGAYGLVRYMVYGEQLYLPWR